MKKIGYLLYAFWFTVFRLFPIEHNRVFMVATHDDSVEGNIGVVTKALQKHEKNFKITMLTKKNSIRHPYDFFIRKAYEMARAKYIFMDNVFLPMAYLSFSKKTKIVQLWHGTGTIKKFAQDVNVGELARLEKRANRRITHLIVNSEYSKKQYVKAFGVREDVAYVLGLPRDDLFFDQEYLEQKKTNFFTNYPHLKNKNRILYAPTFRDDKIDNPTLGLDLEKVVNGLGENDCLLIRLHPYVANNLSDECLNKLGTKLVNVSNWSDVSTLLVISNVLITDYSSIIFEYCLLERPMIFYAYDLEKFECEGRGFYETYEDYVPGQIARTQAELLEALENIGNISKQVKKFKEENFEYLDGNATERLLKIII